MPNLIYEGCIDHYGSKQLKGWCCCLSENSASVELDVFVDHERRGSTATNTDILGTPGNNRDRFHFLLDPPINVTKAHIRVSPKGSDYELTISNDIKERFLRAGSMPLIFPEKKLALLWSAKSGCTYAVKWFFYQMGVLDQALHQSSWIHDYRENTHYKTKEYAEGAYDLVGSRNYLVIKVTRNPFSRAVSSYIHAVRTSYASDGNFEKFLNLSDGNKGNSFSFREFINYLGTLDLDFTDMHHRKQIHIMERLEMIPKPIVIHLEDSENSFRVIEKKYDLKISDHAALRASKHNAVYSSKNTFAGDIRFDDTVNAYPEHKYFYDNELVANVVNLYKEDFLVYGYPTTF